MSFEGTTSVRRSVKSVIVDHFTCISGKFTTALLNKNLDLFAGKHSLHFISLPLSERLFFLVYFTVTVKQREFRKHHSYDEDKKKASCEFVSSKCHLTEVQCIAECCHAASRLNNECMWRSLEADGGTSHHIF